MVSSACFTPSSDAYSNRNHAELEKLLQLLLLLLLLILLIILLHPFNSLFSRTTWVSRYQKSKTSLDLNEARDDGVWYTLASAGPYANNLHLTPDR